MLQHAQVSHAFQSSASSSRTYQISKLPDLDHCINVKIFYEILDLDDEDEQYFTRSLVCDFFTIARRTFKEMDACLETQDVKQLWSKAQFLRGPSGTLGIYKVESSCARIERMTAATDSESTTTLCNSARILLDQAQEQFFEAEHALQRFYGME